MRRFVNDNIRATFQKQLGEDHLENKLIQNVVTNAQKQIEGKNFDIRKNLLDYDDVLAKQRQIIYDRRDSIMEAKDITDLIHSFFAETGKFLAKKAVVSGRDEGIVSAEELRKLVEPAYIPEGGFPYKAYDEATVEEGGEDLGEFLYAAFLRHRKTWPAEIADQAERQISLQVIDRNWTKHIDTMAHLREGISLRSYAHTNPLQDYVNEGYSLFREMNTNIAVDCARYFLNVRPQIRRPEPAPEVVEEAPAAEKAPAEAKSENPAEKQENPAKSE